MNASDLAKLDALCEKADSCVALKTVNRGLADRHTIGLRHDVDDRGFDSMLSMAQWEARRERRSTYYVLHTAPYWNDPSLAWQLRQIESLGHEVGLHNNALAAWWRSGQKADPFDVLEVALDSLRARGVTVTSTAGHGDDACYEGGFVNYSMFTECPIAPDDPKWRTIEELGITPRSLSEFGLDFAGDHVARGFYLSDSGDEWSSPLDAVIADFPYDGPLVILQHPDWYRKELFA